eukprot:2268935-Pyramimonas_sp.AAC.1
MQKRLKWLWERVRVLAVEEFSMAAAALCNALDLRACHGRDNTRDVQESTYQRPHHHFGRAPYRVAPRRFLAAQAHRQHWPRDG